VITAAVGLSYPAFYAPVPAPPWAGPPPYIATLTLPPLMPEVPYNVMLEAQGGQAPHYFTLAAGSGPLPPGLTLTAGGLISGTAPHLAVMTPDTLPPGQVDVFYQQAIVVADILFPITVRMNDSLGQIDEESYLLALWRNPTALSFANGTLPGCMQFGGGGLAGPPMKAGTYPFTAIATDADGRVVTKTYTLVIASPRVDP